MQNKAPLSNTEIKRTSISNEIKEENFIIGMALALKIPLKLQRKSKHPSKLQTIYVQEIMVPELQRKVIETFDVWKQSKGIKEISEQKQKIEQRDYVKTYQNIMINVLIETMMEMGIKFTKRPNRKPVKILEKIKIKMCNGMKMKSMRELGVRANQYLIQKIPIPPRKSKSQCSQIFNSIGPLFSQFPLINTQIDPSQIIDIVSLSQIALPQPIQNCVSFVPPPIQQEISHNSLSSKSSESVQDIQAFK